jgi:citronellol/citronellal dehydrogenase
MRMSAMFRERLLDGRTALVTGGGTNLGRHAAAELVACGARVVIAGRTEDVLAQAAGEIGCEHAVGDIRDPSSAAAIAAAAGSSLDLLVNNAGGQYFVPAESITAKGWAAVMRLNVEGTMTMTEAALPALRAASGMVVNITVSPHHGMPAMAHTGAARAAVEALTRSLSAREPDVAFVAAAIGRFDTESLRKYPDVVLRGAARSVPLQRLGRMEEFGWLIALLATPAGRALDGTVVTLDGGADNWAGPWPPPTIVDEEGAVPTEERR